METSDNTRFLGEEKISKLMLKFSVPCILSLLVSALYNIVDQIFIGNSELSTLGNAATGVVFPIFIIAQAFAWCFGDGCAAYLNICQGKNDTQNAHKAVGSGITVTLLSSFVLMAVFFPLKTGGLTLFGASENSLGMAVEYFNIILAFFPVFMLSNMMNAVIRSDGSPAWSMFSMLAGALLNIALDPAFIFGMHWGMRGAAWATAIGQLASFAVSFVYFFRTKTFKLALKSFIPDFKVFANAFKLGISSFVTQTTIVIISLVCNIMLKYYGKLIGKLVAERLGIPFYYKEMTALAAQESGLDKEFISDINANAPAALHSLYLSTEVIRQAVIAQDKVIRKIAESGSCVIVGRAADYVLRNNKNLLRVFVYAPEDYKIKRIMETYGDTYDEAKRNVKRSDDARASYYKNVSGLVWGEARNYDLAINGAVGPEICADVICALAERKKRNRLCEFD